MWPLVRWRRSLPCTRWSTRFFVHADSNHEFTVAFVVPNPKELEKLAKKLEAEGSNERLCENTEIAKEALKQITDFGIKCK